MILYNFSHAYVSLPNILQVPVSITTREHPETCMMLLCTRYSLRHNQLEHGTIFLGENVIEKRNILVDDMSKTLVHILEQSIKTNTLIQEMLRQLEPNP